ncbi:MAG: siphovirus Gp157 family protein [Rhodopila sp.]|nr:siphovirus Gp157 family protein [Rhodopila sp.]
MNDAPSGWKISQALSAWQSARAQLLADDPDADVDSILGAEAEDVDLIKSGLLSAAQWNATQAKAVASMIEDLDTRRHRFLAREREAKGTLFAVMTALDERKFVAPHGTVSIRAGTPSLVITDEAAIPPEYLRTTVTPDKAAILADLKQGVVIEGAMLSNGSPSLAIRSK